MSKVENPDEPVNPRSRPAAVRMLAADPPLGPPQRTTRDIMEQAAMPSSG